MFTLCFVSVTCTSLHVYMWNVVYFVHVDINDFLDSYVINYVTVSGVMYMYTYPIINNVNCTVMMLHVHVYMFVCTLYTSLLQIYPS